jgi:hypothetical protein
MMVSNEYFITVRISARPATLEELLTKGRETVSARQKAIDSEKVRIQMPADFWLSDGGGVAPARPRRL